MVETSILSQAVGESTNIGLDPRNMSRQSQEKWASKFHLQDNYDQHGPANKESFNMFQPAINKGAICKHARRGCLTV